MRRIAWCVGTAESGPSDGALIVGLMNFRVVAFASGRDGEMRRVADI